MKRVVRWSVVGLLFAFLAMQVPAASAAARPGPELAAEPANATKLASDSFQRGVDAYRRGAYGEAEAHWRAVLDEPLTPEALAQVAYDLGNAAWRRERPFEAIGWYRVALENAPRHADARANMELARAQAGLEPDDRGDLRSTLDRLLTSLRPEEARRVAALALVLLALGLFTEALLGGRSGRRLAFASALVAALLVLPWLRGALESSGDTLLVVRAPSVALRSEPRRELSPTGRVDAGSELQRIDELSGWVRVRTTSGERGWLQADAVFPLDRWTPSASEAPR